MIGYVARDKNGALYLYTRKPYLDTSLNCYFSEDSSMLLNIDFPEFNDVNFYEGPVKVEIHIKKV